jgi:molecular chaperone DnaK
VYETEKNLKEMEGKLDPDTKAKVAAAVDRVKEALKTDNVEEIKSASEALTQIWHQAAATLYQQATSQQQDQTSGRESGQAKESKREPEGSAVDADYEVVE